MSLPCTESKVCTFSATKQTAPGNKQCVGWPGGCTPRFRRPRQSSPATTYMPLQTTSEVPATALYSLRLLWKSVWPASATELVSSRVSVATNPSPRPRQTHPSSTRQPASTRSHSVSTCKATVDVGAQTGQPLYPRDIHSEASHQNSTTTKCYTVDAQEQQPHRLLPQGQQLLFST